MENRKLIIINSYKKDYLLCFDMVNNSHHIMRKIADDDLTVTNTNLNTRYHPKVEIGGVIYESLELIKPYDKNLASSIFNLIVEIDMPLNKAINKIISALKSFEDKVSIEMVRGTFAELHLLKNANIEYKDHKTSIYDFRSNDGNDLEVKSFSKVSRTINVSYQQLTNNKEALLYAVEVYESSAGKSILELINDLPNEIGERYSWINRSNSKLVKEPFESGELVVMKVKDLSEGLVMPKAAKDAKFIFEIAKK